MDVLDPLECSVDHDGTTETKVIINEGINICKTNMDSDDEQNVVDHLSPQTLLETPGENEVQYSLRSPEGMITYRVLQVEDGSTVEGVPQIVSGTNFSNAGVQQVIASNLNGLYVIGNSNEVFAPQTGTRAIAPRSSIIEGTTNSVVSNIRKRDERRRATHNEVERRRRDKINNWIMKLSKIIPEQTPTDPKGNGHYDGQSKGGILAKACEYIVELRDNQQKLDHCMKENKQLSQTIEIVKQKNFVLERENKELRDMLKRSGIDIPSDIVS